MRVAAAAAELSHVVAWCGDSNRVRYQIDGN
jgi:hypothetical protein